MIKLMREGARRYPWILKAIMGTLAVAFIITMGWWGFGETPTDSVAKVGELNVTRDDYRDKYQYIYQFYKQNVQGEFKEETLKEYALASLIEDKLWTLAAEDLRLTVSEEELRADILKQPTFQQDGKFSPDRYRTWLTYIRKKPYQFETLHKADLLRLKAMGVVRDSVALTPAEISEAQSLMARQAQVEGTAQASSERLLQDFLFQKQQRALVAFKDALKSRTPIKIHKENL